MRSNVDSALLLMTCLIVDVESGLTHTKSKGADPHNSGNAKHTANAKTEGCSVM